MTNMLQTSVAMSDIFSIRILTIKISKAVLLKSKDYGLRIEKNKNLILNLS